MLTQLTAPFHTINSDDWKVYGDFCEENSLESEMDFARNVVKGIEKTGGKLYLARIVRTGAAMPYTICYKWAEFFLPFDLPYKNDLRHFWTMDVTSYQNHSLYKPICPLGIPIFSERPDLIESFWQTLAKIGKES